MIYELTCFEIARTYVLAISKQVSIPVNKSQHELCPKIISAIYLCPVQGWEEKKSLSLPPVAHLSVCPAVLMCQKTLLLYPFNKEHIKK